MNRQSGLALVSVLWGLAILSLIAAAMLSGSRLSIRNSRNAIEDAQARAFIDAAVNQTVLDLLDRRPDRQPRIDGIAATIQVLGTPVQVSVEDEFGKIDLNAADRELLGRLFRTTGLDGAAVDALVDKVLDWRERGNTKHLNGGKADDYRVGGLPYGPRDGPFQRVDELALVMGMTPELYQQIQPALTVYSARATFNPQTAPAEALMTLPGFDRQRTNEMIAERGGNPTGLGPVINGRIGPGISLAGWAFTIRVSVPSTQGRRRAFSTVVRLTNDPRQQFWRLTASEELLR